MKRADGKPRGRKCAGSNSQAPVGGSPGALKRVGVLSLQGDYALHFEALNRAGVEGVDVRRPEDLAQLQGLVLPGGESTAMLKLMEGTTLFEDLRRFHSRGGVLFGTCAGLILLARKVTGPEQVSLGVLDVDVARNGYGRQINSFETELTLEGSAQPLPAVFIRAPRIVRTGPRVRVLARHRGQPVLVEGERALASTFHPESTPDTRIHERFLSLCGKEPETVFV